MKIVVDTNVLISAFLTVGTSREVLDEILRRRHCILSPYLLEEFRSTLLSEKFNFPSPLVEAFVDYLQQYSTVVGEEKLNISFSDAQDIPILALCQTVKADFLVTGDGGLLDLKKIGRTLIIRPSGFWKATL